MEPTLKKRKKREKRKKKSRELMCVGVEEKLRVK